MSALPSPLKSPAPLTCQAGPGLLPIAAAERMVLPFISQMPDLPLSFCHRMSALPSPLKSPAPLTCQALPGLLPIAAAETTFVPSISQMPAVPLEFCHRMSDALSALKLVGTDNAAPSEPTRCHVVLGELPTVEALT